MVAADFLALSQERDLSLFLPAALPLQWSSVGSRILNSGARFGEEDVLWWAGWSDIPLTVRRGHSKEETALKSIIYRVHDAIHNLWPNPLPRSFSDGDRASFKRCIMSSEVAVLSIVEFGYCRWIYETFPDLRDLILRRRALVTYGWRSLRETARFLDAVLHRGDDVSDWSCVPEAVAFREDYFAMLGRDRVDCDRAAISEHRVEWLAATRGLAADVVPPVLDGLNTTLWMVDDFERCVASTEADVTCCRPRLVLPTWWPR